MKLREPSEFVAGVRVAVGAEITAEEIALLHNLLIITSSESSRSAIWLRGYDVRIRKDIHTCTLCGTEIPDDIRTLEPESTQHVNTCWIAKLNEFKARPDYESLLAYIELQREQANG